MQPENIDRGTFACSGYPCDAYSARVAAVGQAFLNDLLGYSLMLRVKALYKSNGAAKRGDIALYNAFDHLCDRRERLASAAHEVGVYGGRLRHSAVYCQTGIAVVVFRVMHIHER